MWRSVDGFINYQVSNHGRVRHANTGRMLKPGLDIHGYYHIGLSSNKQRIEQRVRRLVAQEFIEQDNDRQFVDHIDRHIENKNVNDLRWVSMLENNSNKTKTTKRTSSTYKGVNFHKTSNKWRSRLMVNGNDIRIGYFTNEKKQLQLTTSNL